MPDFNITQLRAELGDARKALNAKATMGKLGIQLSNSKNDQPPGMGTKSENLERRAELRRASNALAGEARKILDEAKGKSPTPDQQGRFDEIEAAMDHVNAEIALISNQLDLDDAAEASFSGRSGSRGKGSAVHDRDGRRIGTLLTNAVLRDESAIRNAIGTERASGDDGMTLTDFVRGVANMRRTEAVQNALSVGTDSAGGYTVPTVLMPGIMSALVPASSLLSAGANVVLLTDGAKSFTIPGIATVPTAAWRLEAGNLSVSDPAFRAITVEPQSLAFIFKISRELLADSPNLEQSLRIAVAQSFGVALDLAGLRGSGTAPEIRGLRNVTNVNITSMGTNGATPTNFTQLVAGWKAIATANAPLPTAEIMHPRDLATYANLIDTTNQPLRRPELIANMRQYQTSQIPTNLVQGTSGTVCSEIYQGDFTLMTWYFREQVSMQLLSELYAGTGEVAFACHVRADVAVIYPQAFNVITGVKP